MKAQNRQLYESHRRTRMMRCKLPLGLPPDGWSDAPWWIPTPVRQFKNTTRVAELLWFKKDGE